MADESGPVSCPWEPGNPGPYGDLSHEETDPFQAVDELTARDTQWRTTIRVASLGLEDVQRFLRLSLEGLFLPRDAPPRPECRTSMDEGGHQGPTGRGKEERIYSSP